MRPLDLATAVAVAGAAVEGHVLRELRERGFEGLRPRHGYVVQRLLAGPDTASAIARHLDVPTHVVARMVRELVALGYVEHVTAEVDRRGRPVTLTARGRAAVDATVAATQRLELRMRDAVGGPQVGRSLDTLQALLRLLEVDVEARTVPLPDDRS